MNKIILCSSQRSGSTMIVEDMRNSNVLGNPEEYFIKWQEFDSSVNVDAEINQLFQQGSKDDVFSVKIMANQVKKVNSALKKSSNYSSIIDLFNDASWVYIRRNDSVKQAVSRYIASVTKVNHAIDESGDNHFAGNLLKGGYQEYNKDVPYDFNKIFNEYCIVKKDNLFWDQFFIKNDIKPLLLEYETYSVDNEYSHLNDIAKFAGVANTPKLIERKLKKLSNNVNAEFYQNFNDDIFSRYF